MSITTIALSSAILINAVSFGLFWHDKRAARAGRQRTSERTLLASAAFGGSLGALTACRVFRHKTRKEPFRTRLRVIIALQLILSIIGILALQ